MIKLPVKAHPSVAVVLDADGREILKCWMGVRGELDEMENARCVADALNAAPLILELVQALDLVLGGLTNNELADALRDGTTIHYGAGLVKQIHAALLAASKLPIAT